MFDKDLHKEYSFTAYLEKLLPRARSKDVDLEGKLKLEFYKLEQTFKGDIILNPSQGDVVMENVKSVTVGTNTDKDEVLEVIINKINDRFKGKFTDGDRVIAETMYNKCVKGNKKLTRYTKNNDAELFENSIYIFKQIAQDYYMEQMWSFKKLFEDKAFYASVMEALAKETYRGLRNS